MTAMTPSISSSSLVASTVAVERSKEFLSCAKTALKIGKQQHRNDAQPPPSNAWWLVPPSELRLRGEDNAEYQNQQKILLQEGLLLLETMEAELKTLESLVRRRGHTNDPTQAIAAATGRLEQDTQALTAWLPTIVPASVRRGGQAHKHYCMIQEWFQQAANEQGRRLQDILKVRAEVLAAQTRRRQQFQATSQSRQAVGGSSSSTSTSVQNNPLFRLAPPPHRSKAGTTVNDMASKSNGSGAASTASTRAADTVMSNGARPTTSATAATASKPSVPTHAGGYAYYASSSPYAVAGVGGGGYGGSSGGMRQRRPLSGGNAYQSQQIDTQQQEQTLLMQRQEERKTQMRLREARQAEKGLASLVGMFCKMSTLISEQSEQIDKIEDDVEAASMDVIKGQNAITEVYSLKKGNRPLIIRVFATLIFVIIFMRFYRG